MAGKHRFHDLKGTFTTTLAHLAPGRVVQQFSRHRDFRTTERYIRVAETATRAAVDAVPSMPDVDMAAPIGRNRTRNRTRA